MLGGLCEFFWHVVCPVTSRGYSWVVAKLKACRGIPRCNTTYLTQKGLVKPLE